MVSQKLAPSAARQNNERILNSATPLQPTPTLRVRWRSDITNKSAIRSRFNYSRRDKIDWIR